MIPSLRRMRGIFRRHFSLWLHLEYFFDTFWQPIVEVLIWGFVSLYLSQIGKEMSQLVSFFLGAIVLWAVLRRGQHEVTFTMMEEAWSRNLQNILISPITMAEYFSASIAFGVVKLLVELSLMGFLVGLLFGFNLFVMGWALVPFALNLLLTGWAIGLVVNAAIVYFGRGLVALSWIMAFALQPFSCVFYPLSALPEWAKPVAMAFPATWVFEGMREVLLFDSMNTTALSIALTLNVIYLLIAYVIFSLVMKVALDRGLLTKLEW